MAFGIATKRTDGFKEIGDLTTFRRIGQHGMTFTPEASIVQDGTVDVPTFTRADLTGGSFVLVVSATLSAGSVTRENFAVRVGTDLTTEITTVSAVPASVPVRYVFSTGNHTGYSVVLEIFAMEI